MEKKSGDAFGLPASFRKIDASGVEHRFQLSGAVTSWRRDFIGSGGPIPAQVMEEAPDGRRILDYECTGRPVYDLIHVVLLLGLYNCIHQKKQSCH